MAPHATFGTPVDILPTTDILGEGILWDAARQALWWTDIQGCTLMKSDWSLRDVKVYRMPERVGSFGFVAKSSRFIVGFATGVAIYDLDSADLEWLFRPETVSGGMRFNDGRVDRRGRFWIGTMVEGERDAARACLYSVGEEGKSICHIEGVRISNGLCMSPDGGRLYFADSPTRIIYVYDLLEPEGVLGKRSVFAETAEGAYPDGATIDEDGCLWSAHWGAGRVVRYTPDGRIDRVVNVPASQPTCPCFAGPDLDVLCVTSARDGLTEAALLAEPQAGSVFMYRTGVRGLPEPAYRR